MQMQRRRALAMGAAVVAGGILGVGAAAQQPRVIPVVARKFVFLPNEFRL